MIFADKLIQLRKKNGWSQEELAEQMDVTRQSVSKWESAQSIPDLEKILRLSDLFGVSTDYLLKDEIEEGTSMPAKEISPLRRVSMEEASAFLHAKEATSRQIAFATFLCIISPICIMVLGVISEMPAYGISENVAGGVGMIVLITLIAAAVAIFISCGSKTSQFEYLEKEAFETEYGVSGMVKERKEHYKSMHTESIIVGTCLCILSLIPLFSGIMINEKNDLLMVVMISVMLVLIGIGVFFFVRAGIVWASFEKLLQEGDYSKKMKEHKASSKHIALPYWPTVTAIYLAYSFITKKWDTSWIVWPVAGVLYPAIIAVISAFSKKE